MKEALVQELKDSFPKLRLPSFFGCDDGRYDLLYDLFFQLQSYIECHNDVLSIYIVIEQVEEIEGQLCISHNKCNKYVENLISDVEYNSSRLCSSCGKEGSLCESDKNNVKTLCRTCSLSQGFSPKIKLETRWKYGLILLHRAKASYENDHCELVELYQDGDGEYTTYCKPKFSKPEHVERALKDIKKDGINTYFYDNGTFYFDLQRNDWRWEKCDSDKKKYGVCLDFDGVIHSYKSGFQGVDVIPDPPNSGAFNFIEMLLKHEWDVFVFSTRSRDKLGLKAMKQWFKDHGMSDNILNRLQFPEHKPIAKVYIDDRAWRFEGKWPSMKELKGFTPWHGGKSSSEK